LTPRTTRQGVKHSDECVQFPCLFEALDAAGSRFGGCSAAEPRSMLEVLDLDPDLGSGIGEERWETARHACRAKVLRVPRGA